MGRALVEQSAKRLEPVIKHLKSDQPLTCPGYQVRIVDGNCLAPSEKRLKALRSVRSAALPGRSLVVYHPDTALAVGVLPCEDGHAGERTLMASLVENAQAGELWIADRNFCTFAITSSWHRKASTFVVREHGRNATLIGGTTPPIAALTDNRSEAQACKGVPLLTSRGALLALREDASAEQRGRRAAP